MDIVVLGSNSFAGACLVDKVLSMGFSALGVSRSDEPSNFFLPYKANLNLKNFQFRRLDLNDDADAIISLINSEKPKYIIDFAGQGMVAQSWGSPLQWYKTNLLSKVKLIEEISAKKWLEKYIRISTPEVYGHSEKKLDETAKFNPSTPYAVSHSAIDLHLNALFKSFNFPVIIGRFANFYGPSQQLYRIIPRTILSILSNQKLPLHGGGNSSRAFIYGTDVANAIVHMIKKGVKGSTYHFSSKEFVSIKSLVCQICDKMNARYEKVVMVTDDRIGKDKSYDMTCATTQKILGWENQISLNEGLSKCISWLTENYSDIKDLPRDYIHKA